MLEPHIIIGVPDARVKHGVRERCNRYISVWLLRIVAMKPKTPSQHSASSQNFTKDEAVSITTFSWRHSVRRKRYRAPGLTEGLSATC